MPLDFQKLIEPFPADKIEWRIGAKNQAKDKGMALAFIDARIVMDRLDKICGAGGWQCKYSHANGKTCCDIGIKIDDEWVWKADGAGDTDVEGSKGAFSDAFKRAAVRWGIGRYLYGLGSPWVEIEPRGKSHIIKKSEYGKLERFLIEGAPPKDSRSENWTGPLNKTELQARLRSMSVDIEASMDLDTLNPCVSSYQGVMAQAEKDLPDWFERMQEIVINRTEILAASAAA